MERKPDLNAKNLTETEKLLLGAKQTDAYKLKHGWKFVVTCNRTYEERLPFVSYDYTEFQIDDNIDHFSHLDLTPLLGHDLACWCPLDTACHGDVLIEFIKEKYGNT
jgi:hypothetical protein